jgi:general secretion pathway protein M
MRADFLPRDGRLLAVVLLLIVLLVAYLVFVYFWFVAPQMQLSRDMGDLRDQHARYQRTIAEQPAIAKRMAEVRAYEQSNQGFLSETDSNAASAGLIQRLKQTVTEHAKDEKQCQVVSSQNYNGGEEELYQRATIQVRMRCNMEPLSAIIYDLENGKPYLFIDSLMIYQQRVYAARGRTAPSRPLDVRFNLSGYLRKAGKVK